MTNSRSSWPQAMVAWDQARVQAFRKDLLAWYDKNKRDLPWRKSQNAAFLVGRLWSGSFPIRRFHK